MIHTVKGVGIVNKAEIDATLVTPWTVICQAPLSMGFSREEYWNGLPFPSPEDFPGSGKKKKKSWSVPDPGTEPGSPALQADSLPNEL